MLFKTTEQHEALRAKIRAFAEAEVKPQAFLMDKENLFPDEAIKKLGEMGLMGIPYPKEYGGAGLDALSYAIAVEELYDRCRRPGFEDLVVDGVTVRMCFDAALTASGGFSQNEQKVVETGQWSYLWTEPRYVSMTVPDTFWKTGDRT